MALQPCSECDQRVSTLALVCPNCGAPVDVPRPSASAAALGPPAPRPPAGSGGRRGHLLLLAGALGMALLGALADATARHLKAGRDAAATPARTAAAGRTAGRARLPRFGPSQAADRIAELTDQLPGVGLPHRFAAQAIDSLRSLRMDDAARNAEIDLRLTLADVASQEEIDVAAFGSYTRTLKGLGVVPRKGVHVEVSAGNGTWSASGTHDRLPGILCTTTSGDGQEVQPGQVTCTRAGQ